MSDHEAGYRAIVEHFPNGMVAIFDHDLRYTVVDGEGLRAMGMAGDALVGKRLRDAFPPEVADRDEPRLRATLRGETTDSEVSFAGQHFRVITVPVRGADGEVTSGLVMSQNITSLVHAIEAREHMASELSLAVEAAKLGVWSYDLASETLQWNDRMHAIYGVAPDAFGGRLEDLYARLHPDDRAAVESDFATLRDGGDVAERELRITTPAGELRHVRSSARPRYDTGGELTAYLGVNVDVTEVRRHQDQLRQAQRLEALGRLTGGVAHDLNNLLQVIIGQSHDLLSAGLSGEATSEALGDILDAGQRAERLVAQLMAFGRRQPQGAEVIDVNEVVTASLRMLEKLIGETVVVTWAPSSEPATVQAELGLLEQVIMNLCLNARDAMPHGGTLALATARVAVDDERAGLVPGAFVELVVRDTGIGMSEATASRIFEPFFTTKEQGQGTGLGLSSVYGIVRQHGGSITVESGLGKGSVFRVLWPLIEEPTKATTTSDLASARPVQSGVETLSVLLAEDDPLVRRSVMRSLRSAGHQVRVVDHGREALDVIAREVDDIDVVVMDVVMPVMGGAEAYEVLRVTHPQLPVVFISGYNEADLTRFTQGDLPTSLLTKPFTPDELLHAVANAARCRLRPRPSAEPVQYAE